MIKKLDNLKLILSFYEKDINTTIKDLNSIYHNYKDSQNLKIKEESKFIKKDSFDYKDKETYNKNNNLLKLFKCKYFSIFFNYSSKRKIYLYSILSIIIFVILLFGVYIIILIQYLKKQNYALNWADHSKGLSESTNLLMTNFLIMIYTNQTFQEISLQLPNKDFTSYVYDKLNHLYEAGGLANNIKDLLLFTENNIEYECFDFYLNLNYSYFNLLLEKYREKNLTENFYFTLYFFCEISKMLWHLKIIKQFICNILIQSKILCKILKKKNILKYYYLL